MKARNDCMLGTFRYAQCLVRGNALGLVYKVSAVWMGAGLQGTEPEM